MQAGGMQASRRASCVCRPLDPHVQLSFLWLPELDSSAPQGQLWTEETCTGWNFFPDCIFPRDQHMTTLMELIPFEMSY